MRVADEIMASIQARHARRLGKDAFAAFKTAFIDVTEHQRSRVADRA
jgi:hypothetical protein